MSTIEEFEKDLNDFLSKNGVDNTNISYKDKLKLLHNIVIINENDMILLEQAFNSDKCSVIPDEEDVKNVTISSNIKDCSEYLNQIHNFEINAYTAKYYIPSVKRLVRIEKKAAIKQKIKSLFRK